MVTFWFTGREGGTLAVAREVGSPVAAFPWVPPYPLGGACRNQGAGACRRTQEEGPLASSLEAPPRVPWLGPEQP
jgi:hypothetical protein